MWIYGRGSSRFLLGASAVGVTAQHSTIQYSTVQDLFRTASFTHKRDFLYRVFFIVIGWIPRGTCMGVFLCFGGGEVDGVMYI